MVERVWNGGIADWSLAASWTTPSGGANAAPISGDTATVASGTAIFKKQEAPNSGSFDAVTVALGTASGPLATLELDDAALGSYFRVNTTGNTEILGHGRSVFQGRLNIAQPGYLLLASEADGATPGELVFSDDYITFNASETVEFQGNIRLEAGSDFSPPYYVSFVNNGTVTVVGSNIHIYGGLSGTGTWNLGLESTLRLRLSVPSGQTFNFTDVDGELGIDEPSNFAGTITGFHQGDLIDLTTAYSGSTATYDVLAHSITVKDSGGNTVGTLNHVYGVAGPLVVSGDGVGGSLIGYANTPDRSHYEIAGGDRAMRADVVRATMTVPGTTTPITGSGVRIGIISDSFNADGLADRDAANGYLPETAGRSAVTVLTDDRSGADEGRAMCELIHQVAPGAQLYFSAAGATETSFSASIAALANADCQIIVDDVGYFADPFFQLGGIATAVSAAIARGVNYFTAAGNNGDSYLEQTFAPKATTLYDGTTPVQAHIFDNGTAYETITIPSSTYSELDLQWSAPYLGSDSQGAPDALTLKVYDSSGTYVGTGTQYQNDSKIATTDLYYDFPEHSGSTDYQIAVYLNGNQISPDEFKLTLSSYGDGSGAGGKIHDPAMGNGSGELQGQTLVPGANTVGAIYYGDSAAFGQDPFFNEDFSSSGPGTLLYNSDGTPMTSPQSAGKVNFLAPDGINAPVPGFDDFFGTSAAAPNAAAVAALMLQANPTLTTAQITALLSRSAISLGLSAAEQGAGLIQADLAVALAESTACYCRGTLILTGGGAVAVEDLAIGDRLVTASGRHRPIKWIGTRSYAGRFANANRDMLPVCFKAGSLGEDTPSRDLWVSPKHAMFVDGMLIAAEHLVNGVSVVQADRVDLVEYFHVELDSHDVIIAEGALSETFVDDHSRGMFHNAREFARLYPAAGRVEAVYCAPRVEDGFKLEAVRRRLASRAGMTLGGDPPAGALRGWVERVGGGWVAGWAQSAGHPDAPVCLDVLVDGVVVTQVIAETFRADLRAAGIGDGCHAFAVRLAAWPSGAVAVRRSADRAALRHLPAAHGALARAA